ncbi:hypothetical protein Barb7_02069 [Bacteroidales bacterium Barb7]|nr:hypothetical protein Barb7_02069 [Bacteroidales bacterium Barb7]
MTGYGYNRSFRTFLAVSPLTPHSAALHVGLKSPAPEGHLRNISCYLCCVLADWKTET